MAAAQTPFFSDEEMKRIEQAVARAESHSSGEIATMVVQESDRYREAEFLGALLLSGFVAIAISVWTHHVTIWTYIPVVCLLFFPMLGVFRLAPRLKLSFVGGRRQQEAVRERALRAFYEHGLYRTREETGILIFISLLEHKVWILGDRGIDRKIPPGSWQSLADQLASGIRDGRAAESLCTVVTACGEQLAQHFPRRSDDRNELPDAPITS
ncbi:hypothetical protein GMLC_27680 [Geomonas limicola]|uniref:TPM domain-containing protein n=1 Tax=Geomonas limicola TaxID=2740186 RepID=A0A6V8NDI0_9BACT|nr:TPM domain-containing protein [Geomonas limicola]GFO69189.1 hypothetical protein GMLC_27680 [Geomonas limicola]